MPRWDLSKFHRVSTVLGSAMSSVGEVMAIGKTFEEAIQKAVRMVTAGVWMGLDGKPPPPLPKGDDSKEVESDTEALEHYLRVPTDRRLFFLQYALESNRYDLETIHRLTRIDRWFLARLQRIADLKHAFTHRYSGLLPSSCKGQEAKLKLAAEIPPADLWTMKKAGFSDGQLARYLGTCETIVRAVRQDHLVRPFVQQIDTLAGEVPAETNYLYFSYHASEDDKIAEMLPCGMLSIATTTSSFTDEEGKERIKREEVNRSVVVLGCGAYSIGSSVEFDWCAVSAVRQLRALGDRAAVINFNPETVSTDFDESDALYFEELTVERVLDVVERERAIGVMVSVGGQIANNLALPLHRAGVNILGPLRPLFSIDPTPY